jgi:tetratricopeptide (TPR) repeat protein
MGRVLFILWLVAVSFGPGLASAATQPACTGNSQWTALIQEGRNQHLSAATRERAYQQARSLCPQSPAAYEGLAILLLQRHRYGAALHWIHQGLAVSPHDPSLTLELGVALLSAGQPQAALEVFKALSPMAKGEFYLGMSYRALRDHEAARRALAKSLAMGDKDPYVLYEIIEEDRALRDERQGLRDFQNFYRRFPHSAWLHLLLGNAYISRNNTAGAESEYRKAAELDPKLPLVHFDLGRLDFNQASYSDALRDFQDEIAVDPTFGEAYLYAGTSLRRLGKNSQAIPLLQRAVARDPNFPLAYRELAVAQIQAQQLQAAAATLREGERRFPKEPAFPAQFARVLSRLGKVREAREQSKLAERLSQEGNVQIAAVPAEHKSLLTASTTNAPVMQQLRACLRDEDARCASDTLNKIDETRFESDANYLNLKAEALILLHQDKPALAAIQRAIEIDPHRADLFITRGRIDQRVGMQAAAIKSFLDAEQMQPGAEAPVYYAGMSFFMLGYDNNDNAYYDRAARHFKTAIELNPHDDRAAFMLGVVDSIEFKLPEAQKNLAQALKMNPRNPYYHLHYGMLLSRMGRLAEGRREMKLAETLDSSYPNTYLRLGDLDAQMGRYAEARTQLETAVHLDPHLSSAYYTLGQVDYRLGLRAESRSALHRFQETKSEEEKATDPIGASINAVASRTARR